MNIKLKNFIQVGVSTALVLGVGTAWAFPGHLTGMSAQKSIVKVGEDVNLTVTGTVRCGVTINNANGKIWTIALTDPSTPPSKSFGTSFNKTGKFHVTAQGQGNTDKDCSLISAVAADITVLGEPPACTFDVAVQKDYQAIGIQVKTCEVSSTPHVSSVSRPVTGATVAEVGSANPGLVVTPTQITKVQLSATSLMAGSPLEVKVFGVGQQKYCGSSIVIDQLSPSQINNYGQMSSKYQYETGGWPRKAIFNITEPGTYRARLLINDTASCGYKGEGSISGDLSPFDVVPAVAK